MNPKLPVARKRDRRHRRPRLTFSKTDGGAMLRFLMMASVMALGCTTMVPPAQAQSREKLPAVASGQQTNRVTSRQFDLDHHRPPDHRQRHHHFRPLVPFGFF